MTLTRRRMRKRKSRSLRLFSGKSRKSFRKRTVGKRRRKRRRKRRSKRRSKRRGGAVEETKSTSPSVDMDELRRAARQKLVQTVRDSEIEMLGSSLSESNIQGKEQKRLQQQERAARDAEIKELEERIRRRKKKKQQQQGQDKSVDH